MLRILESQAPAKQSASATIETLSSRLTSATLLEDRRSAILGLRSFAKQYPASVASGALRDLLQGLRRDGEDPETLKSVLETLLILFDPDKTSPEYSDDVPLWLADQFTIQQDNITALLDLVETGEYYLRLYSLQILGKVCDARPQRTQDAIFTAPLGVSRITAALQDSREAVRNEALLLLVALTPTSAELQKVVAFENAFDRVFVIIDAEDGLTHGSTVVQDCLSLFSNLLRSNPSNQAYFREIGGARKTEQLLIQVIQEEEAPGGLQSRTRAQRDINLWGLLAVIQLFLVRGTQGLSTSQEAFWRAGVLQSTLRIAFHDTFNASVRAKALDTCAAHIRGNPRLQEQFGDLAVPAIKQKPAPSNGTATPKSSLPGSGTSTPFSNVEMANVIESLLELTLDPSATPYFDVRLAASNCVKAFFDGHDGIRGHVLRRAIEGHKSGDDAIPNMLTVLLEPPNARDNADQYQQWMAAALLLHLLQNSSENKNAALQVSEDEHEQDDDYEAVSFLQSITSNIVAGVQHPEDEKALIGTLMLLAVWAYEDVHAVNDLLGEGSNIQGICSAVKVSTPTMPVVAGLCCFLLGIIYEFSTKDSPIPRATLHSAIMKNLSREVYLDRLTWLRESTFIRDFEVLPAISPSGVPETLFDGTFVEFFKDNYSRFLRAIDRDPGFEVSIMMNGVQQGVSRELVDSLRSQVEEQKSALDRYQADLVGVIQKLEQEELEHKKTRQSKDAELARLGRINQGLQSNNEEELANVRQDAARQIGTLTSAHETTLAQLKREHLTAIEQSMRQQKAEKEYLEQRKNGMEREIAKLREQLSKQQAENEKAVVQARRIKDEQQSEIDDLHGMLKMFEDQIAKISADHEAELKSSKGRLEEELEQSRAIITQLEESLASARLQIAESNSKHKNAEAQLAATEQQKLQYEKEQSTMQYSLRNSQADLAALQKDHSALKEQHSIIQKEITERKEEPSNLTSEEVTTLRTMADKQKSTQTELDDLLVVFADLQAKRDADKARLKELGEEVSDDEDGEDVEEDEDET